MESPSLAVGCLDQGCAGLKINQFHVIVLVVLLWVWLQMRDEDGAGPGQHGDACLRVWRFLVWPEGLENTEIMV